MRSRYCVVTLIGILTALTAWNRPCHASGVVDDFESYALGAFPAPTWLDVGQFDPQPPFAPNPSAMVVQTTDAFGNPTQALAVADAVALTAGIYQPVNVSPRYALHADMRVDRYSDNPTTTDSDWAMQLTFAQLERNFFDTPQFGVYASSLTEGWRLFLIDSTETVFADIDLNAAAQPGVWYSVNLELDVTTGAWHSRILDTATGNVLSDQADVIAGWTPNSGLFNSVAFFDGEGSPNVTRSNLAVVDNINVSAVPEPSTLALLGAGFTSLLLLRRRTRR